MSLGGRKQSRPELVQEGRESNLMRTNIDTVSLEVSRDSRAR